MARPGKKPTGTRAFLRAAMRPGMIAALAGLLAVAAVCGLLGRWQIGRAQERAQVAERAAIAKANEAGPAPLTGLLRPQEAFTADAAGRRVTASGTFAPSGQLLVPGRELGGTDGYLVLARFETSGAILPVVRGWVAQPGLVPAPPPGTVTLTGILAPSESATTEAAGAGQIGAISSAELAGLWGTPIYPGYLVQLEPDPATGAMRSVPAPQPTKEGWNLQSFFYAIEWWVFGAFALVFWFRLVRDRARASGSAGPGGSHGGGDGSERPDHSSPAALVGQTGAHDEP